MGKDEASYPPKKGKWGCPGCDKKHSKPHYSVPGQIDYEKKPGEPGRILFNRRKAYNDSLSEDTPIDKSLPMRGEQLDEETYQRPLYCPHCGWEDTFIVIIRNGDLPGLVDRFMKERQKGHKTLKEHFNEFLKWLGDRN